MKAAFPAASGLHEAAHMVGSATEEGIRDAGFDVIPNPTRLLPNYHRIVHPDGVAGFGDDRLEKLSDVFVDSVVEEQR